MPAASEQTSPIVDQLGKGTRVMTRELSLYLDFVRFVAAFLVFISHSNDRELSARVIPFANFGHSAVVVFFVLSGFVIAFVAATRELSARDYGLSRAARIYSVALPALVLTLVLDIIGEALRPALYATNTTHDLWLLRFVASALFMNEFWGISVTAFSNVPYWSIAYEVWYYVLFGVFIFWTGPGRVWALVVVALLAGPKILLLLPVWLMGVALYWFYTRHSISESVGLVMFFGSLVLLVLFHLLGIPTALFEFVKSVVGAESHRNMTWSRYFLSDYLLGVIVVANFAGFRAAGALLSKPLSRFAKPIRWAAGYTLSIYLFHKPLILFFTALIDGDPKSIWFWVSVTTLSMATILFLGRYTEHRKDEWRAVLGQLLTMVTTRWKQWMPGTAPRDPR